MEHARRISFFLARVERLPFNNFADNKGSGAGNHMAEFFMSVDKCGIIILTMRIVW